MTIVAVIGALAPVSGRSFDLCLGSISKLHRLAGEVDPCASPKIAQVTADLLQVRSERANRRPEADCHRWLTSNGVPNQACVTAMLGTEAGHEVPDARNRALLLLAVEGRYSPSELVALNWHDIVACDDSSTGETDDIALPVMFRVRLGKEVKTALWAWRTFNNDGHVFRRLYSVPSMDYDIDRRWLVGGQLSRQSISLICRSMLDRAKSGKAFGELSEIDWFDLRRATSARNICGRR
ncbi:hypothetical protein [Sphingomonas sp. SUN039]|uniref:hypothetical protein n=1 Tax=Sphingomonas sp. SUN039 TaxID=2937787 RepID=UPI002164732E|nr:hypothetical protein [Sphingomonas sp. SUN039]UVO54740.1 hypothetical protein M0209_11635 [Sphingomonas sp. SUN039]